MSLISVFKVGLNESLAFKWNIVGDILFIIIQAFILLNLWNSFYPHDFTSYYLIVFFLLPSGLPLYTIIPSDFTQKVIRKGYHLTLIRPIDTILFMIFKEMGYQSIIYIIKFILGLTFMVLLHLQINLFIIIISLPFILLLDISLTYLISSLSFYLYSIGGFRIFINLLDRFFGGILIPLNYVKQYGSFIFALPFAHKTFMITQSALNGTIPYVSYAYLIIWSLIFFMISLPLHILGWKRFDSLGG